MIFDKPISNFSRDWLREIADMEHDADDLAIHDTRYLPAIPREPAKARGGEVFEAFAPMESYPLTASRPIRNRQEAPFLTLRQAS